MAQENEEGPVMSETRAKLTANLNFNSATITKKTLPTEKE